MEKVILITGSSEGIGAATALLAASGGYTVIINYSRNVAAADLVAEHIFGLGGRAFVVKADISDESQVLRLFRETDRLAGPLTALVNNAGIIIAQQKLVDMDVE